ncbi:MAG: ATP-binding protein [Gammaproteobacteria bacterium]|nr:ATP-binding protein [Gammaproteobacteria bacterium]
MAKQIVIVSGKGGTGKTVISGAFSTIAKNKVIVDADVDAADLFLLLNPTNSKVTKFSGGKKAVIDLGKCVKCEKCKNNCHFDAIDEDFIIDEIQCEGCGLCAGICLSGAISMIPVDSGEWYISETVYGIFVHAKLGIAEENSGKLVSLVKQKAIEIAKANKSDWIIIDGPPGIGCPAIAALGHTDCVVVVTEPTLSGFHDAKRVIELANHFKLLVKVIINKCDLNQLITEEIERYCIDNQIEVVGKIKYDETVIQSIVNGQTLMDYQVFGQKDVLLNAWNKIVAAIN